MCIKVKDKRNRKGEENILAFIIMNKKEISTLKKRVGKKVQAKKKKQSKHDNNKSTGKEIDHFLCLNQKLGTKKKQKIEEAKDKKRERNEGIYFMLL